MLRRRLSVGLGPLLSLPLVGDRDIQGKDRCGDHGCCANDPPSAAIMVGEGWDSQNRQREQQPKPGSEHTDPMADPPGDVFAVLALELRPTGAMAEKLREEDDHEGHACPSVEIGWRHPRVSLFIGCARLGRCWIRSLPRRRRVLVLDITQAAAEASRLVHEAYDLNLSIGQPSVIDGDPLPEPAGHGKADQGHDPLHAMQFRSPPPSQVRAACPFTRPLGLTVAVSWIPLVTAAYGTRVARNEVARTWRQWLPAGPEGEARPW